MRLSNLLKSIPFSTGNVDERQSRQYSLLTDTACILGDTLGSLSYRGSKTLLGAEAHTSQTRILQQLFRPEVK
jgi:hypothetical protein